MAPSTGDVFSVNQNSCTINQGETKTFTVTFTPNKADNITDKIVIRSNASDNPTWEIQLSGIGEGGEIIPEPVPTPVPVPVVDDKFLIHSHDVGGVTYSLYKKTDKVNSHPNADGWVFYESDLTLDITKNGWTDTYYVGGGVYLDAGANNGQTQCMAIDLKERMIYIFTNSKTSGRNYTMDGYAYVSSYVGGVRDANNSPQGSVYKVDTLTLEKVDSCTVGYQPEEMAIVGDRLYVANSGGYQGMTGQGYESTVSVVDLMTMREVHKIEVAPNLHRLKVDRNGRLWVTSRGNYTDLDSRLYWLEPSSDGQMQVGGMIPQPVSDLCIVGDSLYFYGSQWSELTMTNTVTYGIVNVRTHQVVSTSLSDAPEVKKIRMPYGIIVNPIGRDFYLMDAKNYVSSGELLHFLPDGTFDWKVRTGDIPAHAAFLFKTETK